jgi:hypothetical protein
VGAHRHLRSSLTALAASAIFALGGAATAHADSVSVSPLPDSTELQADAAVTDQDGYCDQTIDYCGWYGEASEYDAGTACPGVFDPTRGVWIGNTIEDPDASDDETFTFTPTQTRGAITICLYTHDYTGDDTDGQSFYVFNKTNSSAYATIDFVHGCLIRVYVFVNGGNVIDGTVTTTLTAVGYPNDHSSAKSDAGDAASGVDYEA